MRLLMTRLGITCGFLAAIALIFGITGYKFNQYGLVDTLLSLPTSQALWETGGVYLDPYINEQILPTGETIADISDGFRVAQTPDGFVDYFPIGPAVLTLPLTAVLVSNGYDFIDPGTNLAIQNGLAFITSTAALLLLFVLARLWHSNWEAFLISLITFFGSVVFSTMGSAFWSINYTLIFNLAIVIILTLKHQGWQNGRYDVWLNIILGTLLFLTFFCRVASVAVIICTLGYLFFTNRKGSFIVGGVALGLLALFALWSTAAYGAILPPYYGLNRLDDAPVPMWVGLIGNLVSPSRGLLIYMPWLLVPLAGLAIAPQLFKHRLVVYGLAWFGLQWLIASRAVVWWGGASFGPRLLAECMPALILLTLIVWDTLKKQNAAIYWGAISAFFAAGVFAIYLHSYQAFFNQYTAGFWYDAAPAVVAHGLGPYFDWQHAQWRSNSNIVCHLDQVNFTQRVVPHDSTLEPINFNQPIPYTADTNKFFTERAIVQMRGDGELLEPVPAGEGNLALFQGMYVTAAGGRWTACNKAAIYFRVADLPESEEMTLVLNLSTHRPQDVELHLNGELLAVVDVEREIEPYGMVFSAAQLKPNQINVITLASSTLDMPIPREDGFMVTGPVGVMLTDFTVVAD